MRFVEWFYRLGNHDTADGFMWSGRIVGDPITRTEAMQYIRRDEGLKRLPAGTIVLSVRDLKGS